MQYRFRYRPHNHRGELYFDLPAIAEVEADEETFVPVAIQINGTDVDVATNLFEDMDDYLRDHHKDDVTTALRASRCNLATAVAWLVGIYSTLVFPIA